MNFHNVSASKTQAPSAHSDEFFFRPQFADRREQKPDGIIMLRLGLLKKDQSRLRADRIEIAYSPKATRPIEIIDKLKLAVARVREEDWCFKTARIIEADVVEIIERETRPDIKVDGLPSTTCQRVHALCGPDPAANLPALEWTLAKKTKFSSTKKTLIVAAYAAEAEARKADTPAVKRLIRLLVEGGETRAAARELAVSFNPALSPYQFFLAKRQSFLKADQFAKFLDPARRIADRPMAIVVRQLLETPHIVNQAKDIYSAAWKDFEQAPSLPYAAVMRLISLGTLREIDGKIGLAWLVEAEEKIARFLKNNLSYELRQDQLTIIDWVLDHAADLLRKADFELTSEQRTAIRTVFLHRISIITGPPGVGKTAVIALVNAIAAMLYDEEEFPAWVVALAGRAASNAREAGTTWNRHGGMITLHATTIHKALGLKTEDDGAAPLTCNNRIKCGVLVLEEMSMNSSPLVAAILGNAQARHFVFVGDGDQLPPIGPGKPFRDILASEASEGEMVR